jgi:hypothetical protein
MWRVMMGTWDGSWEVQGKKKNQLEIAKGKSTYSYVENVYVDDANLSYVLLLTSTRSLMPAFGGKYVLRDGVISRHFILPRSTRKKMSERTRDTMRFLTPLGVK